MEEKLEKGSKAGVSESCNQPTVEDEVEDSCRETWNQMLSMVKSEISACTGCLDEGVKLLQKKASAGIGVVNVVPVRQFLCLRHAKSLFI